MTSFTGYISYMEFALGNDEEFANPIQNPFTYGLMTEDRMKYTSNAVVETIKLAASKATLGFKNVILAGNQLANGSVMKAGTPVTYTAAKNADGFVEITVSSGAGATDEVRIAYEYDNQVIPQTKIPTIKARMSGVTLTAKARRIAIEYSQFANFQSKNDYGIDLSTTLAQQAQAELAYQTDSEAVFLIKEAADKITDGRKLTWVDEELDTISYSMKAKPILVLA